MSLALGEKLGPYEITALLGKGGMGEVYKAHDSRLNRDVAIKVSTEQFSDRFSREARAIAALNHTNICHLYDVGPNYLVMEYVEGADLRGPLDFDDALPIIQQLIDGIEAAHEKGITHRDLKPANIKVSPEGVVKILDFGLARLDAPPASASGSSDPENSPTMSMAATAAGTILGTAAYMSPEQAKGRMADRRSDIWAFGVIVYELLTGKRLFQGESAVEILGGVLNKEPDVSAAPAQTHKLLRWCLEKDRRQRLQAIGDARRLVVGDTSSADESAAAAAPSQSRFGWLAWSAAGLFAIVAVLVSFIHFRERPPRVELMRFQVFAPDKASIGSTLGSVVRVSPDGHHVAFIATGSDHGTSLWIRSLEAVEARPVAGTEGASAMFWSPDSQFLVFGVSGKLKKIGIAGGPPETLCDISSDFFGGSWNRDGVIIFATGNSGLWRVSAAGGIASPLTKLDAAREENFHAPPVFLPDQRHFIYLRNSPKDRGVYVGSLDARPEQQASKRLLATEYSADYAPSPSPSVGHLLFVRAGTLMAQPFNSDQLELMGEAVPVAENVGSNAANAWFSASATGVLAYRTGSLFGQNSQLTWFDRQGKRLGTAGEPAAYDTLAISPDSMRVAVDRRSGGGRAIWLHEFERGVSARLTFDPTEGHAPVWSPDGSRIVFLSGQTLYEKVSTGAGNEDVLLKSNDAVIPNDWSRDGRFLLYSQEDPKTGWDLWVLPLDGDRKSTPYLRTQFPESQGVFSPDSRWVAYRSAESGTSEVYVRPFPASSGGKWMVSKGGGFEPRWRRDGKELFYISPDGTLWSVDVSTSPTFKPGVPRSLFQTTTRFSPNYFRYDVTTDGQRFLANEPVDSTAGYSAPITVVLNWQAMLKK
jgi:eukaryotic-like serine/threonine-protein kinase